MTDPRTILRHDKRFTANQIEPDSMLGRLVLFWRWCEADLCWIRDADEEIVPLHLNHSQRRLLAKMMDQAVAGKPIRIITGKARKQGASTMVQVLFVFLCAHYRNQRAITLAHEATPTDEIFAIAKLAATKYHSVVPVDPIKRELRYGNNSLYTCHTAGGVAVGAGGTPNLLHLSELSKWERNKVETEYNAKVAVPDSKTSIIVVESTFKGRELFARRYDEAADPMNEYDSVFNAWYLDARCTATVIDGRGDDDREVIATAAAEGVELSNGQLQWRRNKIISLGAGVFRQEYPSTPSEAIQANKGLVLPGMRNLLIDELPFVPDEVAWSERIGGIDFGYHDPTVIFTGFYVDQIAYVTDVWREAESLACDQVDALHDGHTYYCDPANLANRKELSRAAVAKGLRCKLRQAPRHKHPGEDTSATEMRALIRLGEEGRLYILRSCAAQLLVECDSLGWNESTGKPDDRRTDESGHFDSIMSLKYLAMGVVSRGVAVKQGGGVEQKKRRVSRKAGFAGV